MAEQNMTHDDILNAERFGPPYDPGPDDRVQCENCLDYVDETLKELCPNCIEKALGYDILLRDYRYLWGAVETLLTYGPTNGTGPLRTTWTSCPHRNVDGRTPEAIEIEKRRARNGTD